MNTVHRVVRSAQQSSPVRYADPVTEYLTRAEAAALLRVSVATLDRHARAARLAKHKLRGGRAVRYLRTDVLALLTKEGNGS